MMANAVIIDAIRTPMGRGRPGGVLSGSHPVDLLAGVLRALVDRNGIDPGTVDDVIMGCVSQVGEQAATPARMAALAAGFPVHVPGMTIDRKCGSGQQAIGIAAQSIMAGVNEIVIAGGIESMSRVTMGSAGMGQDTAGPGVRARFQPGLVSQGIAAELVAARWSLTRESLDSYSAQSHHRAAAARDAGWFDDEIVAVETDNGRVSRDETIRDQTTVEGLASLKPVFVNEEIRLRFTEINWSITAGNSSQLTDGASALLIMSETMAAKLGLRPRARFAGFDVCGSDPIEMLTAPIPSTRRLLQKTGIGIGEIAHFEVNEAFAPVPLAWARALDVDEALVNPRGGAIALGHPLGASGARLMTTMLHALEQTGARYGLQTMCEAGGMANATIIERLS